MAFIAEEDGRCSGCGHPRDEAWVEPATALDDPWVVKQQTCYACDAAERRAKSQADNGPMPRSMHTWVTKA